MKRISFIFITYFAIPITALEVFAQFRFESGYIYNMIVRKDLNIEKTFINAGFHKPNKRKITFHKTIYGDPEKIKKTIFATDKHGTIVPSTLEIAESKINNSVLFCGGSTTENFAAV